MAEIIEFPRKPDDAHPLDQKIMCSISITGGGSVTVDVDSHVETVEQWNWLLAAVSVGVADIVLRKRGGSL